MKTSPVAQLISLARHKMVRVQDPIHGIDHVERVVGHVEQLCAEIGVSKEQKDAVLLAAWWHDVSRNMSRKPSLVWMPLVDDFFSALLLWFFTIRYGLFGSVAGIATRLVFCKGLGTGAFLTRVLLRKRTRVLLDILKDADGLDLLHIDRVQKLHELVGGSRTYQYGYRVHNWWCLTSKQLHMRTRAARKIMEEIICRFLAWLKKEAIMLWHKKLFGAHWVDKNLQKWYDLLAQIQFLNRAGA